MVEDEKGKRNEKVKSFLKSIFNLKICKRNQKIIKRKNRQKRGRSCKSYWKKQQKILMFAEPDRSSKVLQRKRFLRSELRSRKTCKIRAGVTKIVHFKVQFSLYPRLLQ